MTVAFLLVLQKFSKQLQVPEIKATQQTNLFIFALLVSSSYCHFLGSQKISSFYHDNPGRKEEGVSVLLSPSHITHTQNKKQQ